MVLGGLFFGAPSAFFLWLTIVDGPVLGIAGSVAGLVFSLALIAFTSSGVHADAARRGIVRWSGPGFPLFTKFVPVDEDHQLELVTKTVTHQARSNQAQATITVHTVAFVREGDRLLLAQGDDRNEMRRRAELVAKAFAVDLHEDNEGKQRTVSLADLDIPLRSRLLRGKAPKRPKKPSRYELEYKREGVVGTIDLPAPAMSWTPLLVFVAAVGAMVFFWFNRGTDSEVPFYIGLTGFIVLFSSALRRLLHHRTRVRREAAQIVASPDGLQLRLRGMLLSRQLHFTAVELEDLEVVQVGNEDIYALLARSDEREVLFAAGTSRSALRWTRKAIAYHLTR